MPVKKTKKPRARRAPAKKKGLKQKQKQRQEQKVNVSVSAGGSGGGGTQFVPMPSAPAFDYAQLAQLIRPANTVDVPIRAQANPEPLPAREMGSQTLIEEFPRPNRPAPPTPMREMGTSAMLPEEIAPIAKARKVRSDAGKSRSKPPLYATMTERESGYETFPSSESEPEVREILRKKEAQAAGMFRGYGSFERDPFM
jgi:hypothetical protein